MHGMIRAVVLGRGAEAVFGSASCRVAPEVEPLALLNVNCFGIVQHDFGLLASCLSNRLHDACGRIISFSQVSKVTL